MRNPEHLGLRNICGKRAAACRYFNMRHVMRQKEAAPEALPPRSPNASRARAFAPACRLWPPAGHGERVSPGNPARHRRTRLAYRSSCPRPLQERRFRRRWPRAHRIGSPHRVTAPGRQGPQSVPSSPSFVAVATSGPLRSEASTARFGEPERGARKDSAQDCAVSYVFSRTPSTHRNCSSAF